MNKENDNVEVVEDDNKVTIEPESNPQPQDEKKYTDADVDKIIDKKFAKWKKEQEDKAAEAEKLRKMNEQEKADYEAKKQADYIAELEAKLNRNGLEKEASKMLSEGGLTVDDQILGLVVKSTAEETQEAVNSFVSLVNDLADVKVAEMLKGKTPKKVEQSTGSVMTKEQFNRLGYRARLDLKESDPALYEQLSKG